MKGNELLKDFRKMQKVKYFMDNAKAVARFERGNVEDIRLFILCTHGNFKDCLVKFQLDFSGNKYLHDKPGRKCLTNIFHPNINSDGSICFSIFDDHFDKNLRLENFVDAFVFLLTSPNHSSPLRSSCVEHDCEKFARYVQDAADGKQVKGATYDKCKIEVNIKDSQDLSKFIANLEVYEANMTIYKEVECRLNDQIENSKIVGKIKSLRPKLFSLVKEYAEKMKILFSDLKSYLDGSEKEKFEDGIKRVNNFCSRMDEVVEYAKNHEEVAGFDNFEEKFLDRVKKRFVGWKKNFLTDEKVMANFQVLFKNVNLEMKKVIGQKNKDEDEEEGEEEEEEEETQKLQRIEENGFISLDSHVSFCANLRQFKEDCETLFLVERKTQILRGRISSRLGGGLEDPRGYVKPFVENDLKILRHETDNLYRNYIGFGKKEVNSFDGDLQKSVDYILKTIRKNSKVNLEYSQQMYLMDEEMEENKIQRSDSEVLGKKWEVAKQLLHNELHPRVAEPAEKLETIRVDVKALLDTVIRKELDRLIEKKKDEEERKDILDELMASSSSDEEEEEEEDSEWLWTYEGNKVVKKRRNKVFNERLSNYRRKN